jgi:hypothetical protein
MHAKNKMRETRISKRAIAAAMRRNVFTDWQSGRDADWQSGRVIGMIAKNRFSSHYYVL